MADIQLAPYTVEDNFTFTHHQFRLNKKIKYTDLAAKLTEDFIHDLSHDFQKELKEYGIFFRGPHDPAYGEGIRHIYIHGGYETIEFIPPTPGTKESLYVPYHRDDSYEIYNHIFRLSSFSKDADILAASDVFINVGKLWDFREKKRGSVVQGCFLVLYLFMTRWLGANKFNRYESLGGLGTIALSKEDDQSDNGKKAALAKKMFDKVKDQEENITNIYKWSCFEWLNEKTPEQVKRYKTESLKDQTKDKAKKLFRKNDEITSAQTADCITRMIMFIVLRMQRPNFRNMPNYSGNDQQNKKTFTENEIGFYMSEARENIVILMSPNLYNFLESWATTNIKFTSSEGGYNSKIESVLKMKIIQVDILPINLIKISSQYRYNMHILYGKTVDDSLNQRLLTTHTAHTAYLYGTKEKCPAAQIYITDGNFGPQYNDDYDPPVEEDLQ